MGYLTSPHLTGAEIKTAYEAEVNAYTDTKNTKLAGIATGADVSTKEFFVPVSAITNTGAVAQILGDFPVLTMDATDRVHFSFKCPHDFSSLTECKVIGIKITSGTIDWTVRSDYGAVGESYNLNSATVTANGLSMTANKLEAVDISSVLASLAADDYVGIRFDIDVISAGDYRVIGLVFKYS